MNAVPKPMIRANAGPPTVSAAQEAVFILPEEVQWDKVIPELGERSPRHAVLWQDKQTNATTMLIWIPPNFHVPLHWHSGNERHLVIRGSLTMKCPEREVVMKPGTFNFMPARVVHQAWTPADEDCLLLNDVDTLWDVNWVNEPPGEQR
jgi:mannose-6-phosphate isomerase-like protein (cupin superfamily)